MTAFATAAIICSLAVVVTAYCAWSTHRDRLQADAAKLNASLSAVRAQEALKQIQALMAGYRGEIAALAPQTENTRHAAPQWPMTEEEPPPAQPAPASGPAGAAIAYSQRVAQLDNAGLLSPSALVREVAHITRHDFRPEALAGTPGSTETRPATSGNVRQRVDVARGMPPVPAPGPVQRNGDAT